MCRFINADAYASTGQGILGNNMFAYCNNNPITFVDPYGLACCFIYLSDDPFAGIFFEKGGGGGGCSYGAAFVHQYSKDANGYYVLEEDSHDLFGGTLHNQIFLLEWAFLSFSNEGFSLINFSASMYKGFWEYEDVFELAMGLMHAELSAGINSKKGVHCSAITYCSFGSANFNFGPVTITFTGYLEAAGYEFEYKPGSHIKFGGAYMGNGGSFTISW